MNIIYDKMCIEVTIYERKYVYLLICWNITAYL